MSDKRPDWSKRLPRPIIIPLVRTLADVRELLRHLLKEHRPSRLGSTSQPNSMRPLTAPIQLMSQMVLGMERVDYRLK
jgi:hypothetical protein